MRIAYFEETGVDAPRADKETIKRNNVFVILKHAEKDEFCLLDWKNFGWRSFIVGGIEEGENILNAAKREVIEETGYTDFGDIKELGFENNTNFYAKHKGVNRYSIEKYVYIELSSMQNIGINPEEVVNHDFIWVKREEVENFLNLNNNLYTWRLFTTGKQEDEEYLKTLSTFKGFK